MIGTVHRAVSGIAGRIGVERKGFADNGIIHWVAAAAASFRLLALTAVVPFLSQSQREGIVGLPATAVADVGAIACGSAVASSLRARLTVIIIDVVLVPKVVPATATSRIAALVTRVAMMAARISPPAAIGVLLEHSMGEM